MFSNSFLSTALFAPHRMKARLVRKGAKQNAAGKAPVYLRLTYGTGPGPGKHCFIATGVYLLAKEWDQKSQAVKGREPEHDAARGVLRRWLGEAEETYQDHRKDKKLSVLLLKNYLLGKDTQAVELLTAADLFQQNQARPELRRSMATLARYKTEARALTAYLMHCKTQALPAADVDKAWLRGYERWCVGQQGYGARTAKNYLSFVQSVVGFAAHEKWIASNPVERYVCETPRTPHDPAYLPEADVQRLVSAELPRVLDRARRAWLFCCFTGLSYVDYYRYATTQLHTDEAGKRWIRAARQKTGTKVSIPVLPELAALLERGEVPKLKSTYFNRRGKDLTAALELSLPLTAGLARHTASHRLRNVHGMSAAAAAAILGHGLQIQHSNYSRMREEGLVKDMEKAGVQQAAPSLLEQLQQALANPCASKELRAQLAELLKERTPARPGNALDLAGLPA